MGRGVRPVRTTLDEHDDGERRALAYIAKLPDAKRRKLHVAQTVRKPDVALLPEHKALDVLRRHRIVQQFGLDAQEVHRIVTNLLSRELEVPRSPSHHPTTPVAPFGRCRYCDTGMLVANTECVSCDECGTVAAGVIEHGNPYREFEDKPTRRHFECVEAEEGGAHSAVSHVGGHAQMSPTAMIEASRLLRAHPRAGGGLVAAAAALIVVTMDYDAHVGALTTPPSPTGFTCTACGAKTATMKSARYHCRTKVGPQAIRVRSLSRCPRRP